MSSVNRPAPPQVAEKSLPADSVSMLVAPAPDVARALAAGGVDGGGVDGRVDAGVGGPVIDVVRGRRVADARQLVDAEDLGAAGDQRGRADAQLASAQKQTPAARRFQRGWECMARVAVYRPAPAMTPPVIPGVAAWLCTRPGP
jgi:hypothetical protein